MGPIRNPNWSTSGMRVTLSYLDFVVNASQIAPVNIAPTFIKITPYKMYIQLFILSI